MPERRATYRTAREVVDEAITEAEFQARIVQLAKLNGWLVYHTHRSDKSECGFPDLVLLGHGRLIFAELKREKGHTTPEQRQWLEGLKRLAERKPSLLSAFVWRPHDWEAIIALLEDP